MIPQQTTCYFQKKTQICVYGLEIIHLFVSDRQLGKVSDEDNSGISVLLVYTLWHPGTLYYSIYHSLVQLSVYSWSASRF